MNWETIERALQAWVKLAVSFPDSHVIQHEQSGDRPSGDYLTIRLGDVIALGAFDEKQLLTNLSAPGQEVEERVQGLREFTVTIQAFGSSTVKNSSGRVALTICQTALALSSVRALFADAGFTVFDVGTVQNITALRDTLFESRAVLEIRCYARATVSEFSTYIETVEAENFMGPPNSGTRDGIDI